MLSYRNGKVTQQIGTLSLYNFDGDFSKAVEYLQNEFKEYTEGYVEKEGLVYGGIYADTDMKKHGVAYAPSEQRKYKFNRIYLNVETVYDYDDPNGKKEIQVWGERDISASEQAALDKQGIVSKEQQEQRDRAEFERLKVRFGEK